MTAQDHRLTLEDFRGHLRPMLAPREMTLLPARIWSDNAWAAIRRGLRAEQMEDRWDVLTRGDRVMIHRSWTGFGVYEARLVPVPTGGRRVESALVETDRERYRGGRAPDHDSVTLEMVLGFFALDEIDRTELLTRWRASLSSRPML